MQERILGGLPYLLPMIESLNYGLEAFGSLPPMQVILQILSPVVSIYYGIPLGPLLIFFLLFFLVIRNPKVPYFIRFQTFQAILLDIFAFLCSLVLSLLGFGTALAPAGVSGSLSITALLYGALFIFIFASAVVGMIKSFQGEYANLPVISEVANQQMRF